MKTRTISRCAAVLLALAVFLCGCTGGGTSSAGETPPAESRVESPAPRRIGKRVFRGAGFVGNPVAGRLGHGTGGIRRGAYAVLHG